MSQGFRNLQAWQRSKAIAVAIYRLTNSSPLDRDFTLRDQMRRAAISVCSNLAEGDARQTGKESVQFFSSPRVPWLNYPRNWTSLRKFTRSILAPSQN